MSIRKESMDYNLFTFKQFCSHTAVRCDGLVIYFPTSPATATTFIQFSRFIHQLQQGPVVVSWTNLDEPENIQREENPTLHLLSKLLVCKNLTLNCIHISGSSWDLLQWQNSWVPIYRTAPALHPDSAWTLWQEHKHSTGKEKLSMGKMCPQLPPSALLLFFGLADSFQVT